MEKDRHWAPAWKDLDVSVQKTITLNENWRHPHGFAYDNHVHVPYDTLSQLNAAKPDVIISAEMGLRTVQAALYRKLHPKSRLIIWATLSEYTEQGRGRARELLRKILLPAADAVIVNGESGARYIKRFGFPDEKIFRVPQTTDLQPFLDQPLAGNPDSSTLRMLYSGRLIELKGLVPFVEHLKEELKNRPGRKVEIWFVGDGPLRQKLEALEVPSNLSLKVLGNLPYPELPKIYKDCDLLILPTLSDEWGLVVVEAMAAGLPVLGSLYSQAVEELVKTGETGWIHSPSDGDATRLAIGAALDQSSEDRKAMGQRSREKIRPLTPEAVGARILKAIESRVS